MIKTVDDIIKTRHFLLNYITDVTVEQLNIIPEGFNNNIIWNLGHLIAAQQGICYARAGLPVAIDANVFSAYKPGTRPEGFVNAAEVQKIKDLLFSSLDTLPGELEKKVFNSYPSWITRYGVEITSVNDALNFIMHHEGMHSGIILAMKRLVNYSKIN